ncbi:MAG: hypothetical protein KKI02_10945 [Planctomycetes bacterium]|nr:hypothetical protein [Planctomycetota bacterium]
MPTDYSYGEIWRDLRGDEPNLLLRGGVSIALGALLAGFAVLGGYTIEVLGGSPFSFDETMGLALTLGAVAWFAVLWCIWGPARRLRVFIRPFIATLIVVTLTGLGMYFVDYYAHYDEEVVMGGIALSAGGLVVFLWLGTLHRLIRGRPVIGRDKHVDVRCPSCGYCLVGLRDLRCPECGTQFTIDELIRAQHYGDPRRRSDAIKLPGPPPPIPGQNERVQA